MKIWKYILIVLVLGLGVFLVFQIKEEENADVVLPPNNIPNNSNKIVPNPVACTQEAKQCPDGSYVSRTGPNCEFALCPTVATSKSGIKGTVTLGPTCPVERIPPDPNCAPKFYTTSINIMKAGNTEIIKTVESDSNGAFSVNLDPGSYVLEAKGENVLPRCGDVSVEVKSGQYANAIISCDTGIR